LTNDDEIAEFLAGLRKACGEDLSLDDSLLCFLKRPRYRLFVNPMPQFSAALFLPYRIIHSDEYHFSNQALLNVIYGVGDRYCFLAVDHDGKLYMPAESTEPRKQSPDAELLLDDVALWKLRMPSSWQCITWRKGIGLAESKSIKAGYEACRTHKSLKKLCSNTSDTFNQLILEFESRQLEAGLSELRQFQVGNAWAFMRKHRIQHDMGIYNWLIEGNAEVQKYRRQAARAYPFLSPELTGYVNETENYQRLSNVIDCAEPLLPILSDMFCVRKATLRHLAQFGTLQRALFNGEDITWVVKCLDAMQCKQWPCCEEEWEAFALLLRDIPREWNLHGLSVDKVKYDKNIVNYLCRMANRGWVNALAYMEKKNYYSSGLESILEVTRSLNRVLPVHHDGLQAVVDKLSGWDMRTWHDVVEKWHQGVLEYKLEQFKDSAINWPRLVPETNINGYHFKALTTPLALEEEDLAMRHCVATYIEHCLFDRRHIITQRQECEEACCTLEVRVRRKGDKWWLEKVQHQGIQNTQPTAVQKLVADKWMEWANSEADFTGLERALKEREVNKDEMLETLADTSLDRERHALEKGGVFCEEVVL